jgi:hypothetical protein
VITSVLLEKALCSEVHEDYDRITEEIAQAIIQSPKTTNVLRNLMDVYPKNPQTRNARLFISGVLFGRLLKEFEQLEDLEN